MLRRERIFAANEIRVPDAVPVEYSAFPAGFIEHCETLRQLWIRERDDLGPPDRFKTSACKSGPRDWRDDWGIERREQAFGAGCIPTLRPRDDWHAWPAFRTPPTVVSVPGEQLGGIVYSELNRYFVLRNGPVPQTN